MDRRALLVTGILCAATMQIRGAAAPSLGGFRSGHPPMNPGLIGRGNPQLPGMGGGRRFGHGGHGFWPLTYYWPYVPWFNGAPCTAFPDPVFGGGFCAPNYVPPAPPNVIAPQVNVAPPPPVDIAPGPAEIDMRHLEAPAPDESRAPADENAGARFYQSPAPLPVVLDEYPSLVVLKSGGVYAVTKYWTKAKTLYFMTPNGRTFQTPLHLLEQVYPGTKTLKNQDHKK